MESVEELCDAARRARECAVMGQAVELASWIGTGRRPVTPGGVLRKADVPAVGAVLGVVVPAKLRTMADIEALNRPWSVAVAAGLLQLDGGWVTAGPALERWPLDDEALLAGWLAGLRAVCAGEPHLRHKDSMGLLALALLTVLSEDGAPPVADHLWWQVVEAVRTLSEKYREWEYGSVSEASWYGDAWPRERLAGLTRMAGLLAELGAVVGEPAAPVITPLGRWAARQLTAGLAASADPGLPAGELLADVAKFADEEQQDNVARAWLAAREPAQAAREILAAAETMSPLQRTVAIRLAEMLGDDALPAWREMLPTRCVGPHARAVLANWEQGPAPADADWAWLAVETAVAALEDKGPDETLSIVWEAWPGTDLDDRLALVRATGHPDAEPLTQAVAEFAASGASRSIDQVAQLKVSLTNFRPPIWRRVLLPSTVTLGDLHQVIQVLFGWDGDHLHVFTLGKKQYGSSFVRLERTGDEETIRVGDAAASGGKIAYTYDLGAGWEHEIRLEKIVPRKLSQQYPGCVAFQSDSPVEYWDEDRPEKPKPFRIDQVNRRLAALGRKWT